METWAGRDGSLSLPISMEVEIQLGCPVMVSRLPTPFFTPEPPGPGKEGKSWFGWTVWGVGCSGVETWVKKGSYHTAWAVPPLSSWSCSHACGQGTSVGPLSGKRCWPLPAGLWGAIAPLMKAWCAKGEVATAVMMVRAGLAIVTFLSWMVNECQDAFRHSADPGSEQEDQRYVPLDRATCCFLSLADWSSMLSANVCAGFFLLLLRSWWRIAFFWAPRCSLEPCACGRGVLALQVHLFICTGLGSRKVCLAFLNDLEVIPVVKCLKCRHWQNSPVFRVIVHVWYVGPKGHLSGKSEAGIVEDLFFSRPVFSVQSDFWNKVLGSGVLALVDWYCQESWLPSSFILRFSILVGGSRMVILPWRRTSIFWL